MPGSSKWSPSLRLPHQNPIYTSPLLRMCYMSCPCGTYRGENRNVQLSLYTP
jgi:hypothetical protein